MKNLFYILLWLAVFVVSCWLMQPFYFDGLIRVKYRIAIFLSGRRYELWAQNVVVELNATGKHTARYNSSAGKGISVKKNTDWSNRDDAFNPLGQFAWDVSSLLVGFEGVNLLSALVKTPMVRNVANDCVYQRIKVRWAVWCVWQICFPFNASFENDKIAKLDTIFGVMNSGWWYGRR